MCLTRALVVNHSLTNPSHGLAPLLGCELTDHYKSKKSQNSIRSNELIATDENNESLGIKRRAWISSFRRNLLSPVTGSDGSVFVLLKYDIRFESCERIKLWKILLLSLLIWLKLNWLRFIDLNLKASFIQIFWQNLGILGGKRLKKYEEIKMGLLG